MMMKNKRTLWNVNNSMASSSHARSRLLKLPANRPSHSFFRFFLMSGLLAIIMTVGDASAQSSNPGNSTIRSTAQSPQTFNAYVAASENLDVTFTKVGNFNTDAQTINVSDPEGITDTCTIPAGTAPDVCSFTNLTSTTSGIWEIEVVPITGSVARLAWEIDVQNGTTSIPGRVFTTTFSLWQDWQNYTAGGAINPDPTNLDQLDLWYVGEDGYQYETNYRIYNGNGSRFTSDGIGNRVAGTCLPAYRSLNTRGPNVDSMYEPFRGGDTCGEPYKIFFEPPADDLPTSATRPDGSTDWLVPPVSTPDVSNLTFAPDGGATHSGTLSFDVSDFTGVATVLIDTDGDGTFNGPDDVSIPTFVTPGDHSVDFDGLDGSDNAVPSTRTINARALIDRAGEIHFVNDDVERRSGGIEVTKLNGPEADDATIYWDDRFITVGNRCSLTPNRDGRAGIDSGSSSAHNWGRCSEADNWGNANDGINGAWGDSRTIDDWTYHSIDESIQISIAAEPLDCGTDVARTLSGSAQAWTPGSTWQDNFENEPVLALNGPDGDGVQLWQDQGNVFTLDMSAVVPENQIVTLHLAQVEPAVFHGDVVVESSADGVTFGGAVTITPSAILPDFSEHDYIVPAGGARFIRITPQDNGEGGTAIRVDALTYSYEYCECADAVNWVQQGSFEEFSECSIQSGTFGAWSVIQNNIHIWGQGCFLGWDSPDGENSIDLDGLSTGGTEQVISGLTPGNTYNLTFYQAFNPADGAEAASMRVQIGDFDDVYTSASNATVGGFNQVHIEFTAGSATETLRFESLTGSNDPTLLAGGGSPGYGVVLDDIRITPQNCSETPPDIEISLTGGPCWRMLSSPVEGLTYADMLENLWTQGAAGSDYPGGEPNIFLWPDGQAGNDPAGWQPLGDLNQVIPPGTGFLISVYADDDYDGVDDPFPKTLSVSGPAHTGDVTPPVNTTDGGWTLVGNPYTQPVDFTALTTNELTDVGYVYDRNYGGADGGDTNGNTGGWRSTDGTYGDVTDGAFAPGQGFFVQNTDPAASPSITFTEADQTTGGEFYGKENELIDYIRLELQGESLYNSLWIRFSGDGSVEPAYGDALELQPLAEQYAIFGARKTDDTLVDIGHFPLPDEALEIPVHVEATQNGTYTLTATDLDIPAGTELYLHDLDTGETVAITDSFEYTFTISQAAKSTPDQGITSCSAEPAKAKTTGGARFMITTSAGGPGGELPDEVALGQNYPNPFNPATQITYELPQASEVHLEVFDMLGRRVAVLAEGTMQAGVHQVTFDAAHLTSGVYLYRLTAGGQIFTKKLTLIK